MAPGVVKCVLLLSIKASVLERAQYFTSGWWGWSGGSPSPRREGGDAPPPSETPL